MRGLTRLRGVQQTLGQAWVTSFQIKSNRVWEWLGWAYTICWLVGLNILTVFFLSVLSRAPPTRPGCVGCCRTIWLLSLAGLSCHWCLDGLEVCAQSARCCRSLSMSSAPPKASPRQHAARHVWLRECTAPCTATGACAAALDKQSAVMEEEQLQERELGIHGNADSRKTPQPIIEGDENDVEANGTDMDGVTQVTG